MARHADILGNGAIDTVAAEAQFVPPSSCQVFGWSSRASSSTPAWTINVTNCDASLLYDDDRAVDISDDGSAVAFTGTVGAGKDSIPTLWLIDGQTGAVRYSKTLAAGAAGGPVQLSENGAYVAWTQGDSVSVYDGTTGALRATLNMGWNTMGSSNRDLTPELHNAKLTRTPNKSLQRSSPTRATSSRGPARTRALS